VQSYERHIGGPASGYAELPKLEDLPRLQRYVGLHVQRYVGDRTGAADDAFLRAERHEPASPSGFSAFWASTNISIVGSVGANTWSLYAGAAQTNSTVTDAAFHAIQTVFNNTILSAYSADSLDVILGFRLPSPH
jgi:hypothetical protein